MKNLIPLCFLLIFSCFTFTGCYYDKEDMLYPSCDSTHVTYKQTIAPIMARNCNGCHYASATNAGGVITDNYNDLSPMATLDGVFWRDINWLEGKAMPKGGAKLSPCDIGKIKKWINEGALDN